MVNVVNGKAMIYRIFEVMFIERRQGNVGTRGRTALHEPRLNHIPVEFLECMVYATVKIKKFILCLCR
jgi:hypothetical protein